MVKKTADKFQAYRPKTEEVAIGEGSLILKTATLDQESRFLALLDGLDIGELLSAITSIVPDPNDPDGGTILKIAEVGPQIWAVARNVLGNQFAPAVRRTHHAGHQGKPSNSTESRHHRRGRL